MLLKALSVRCNCGKFLFNWGDINDILPPWAHPYLLHNPSSVATVFWCNQGCLRLAHPPIENKHNIFHYQFVKSKCKLLKSNTLIDIMLFNGGGAANHKYICTVTKSTCFNSLLFQIQKNPVLNKPDKTLISRRDAIFVFLRFEMRSCFFLNFINCVCVILYPPLMPLNTPSELQ